MSSSRLDEKFWAMWHYATQPHPSIQDNTQRLYARALMVVSFLMIPILLAHNIFMYLLWKWSSYDNPRQIEITLLALCFLSSMYWMSYQGYVLFASRFGVLFASGIIISGFWNSIPVEPSYQTLNYLAIALVFLSLYLNPNETFLVLVTNSAILLSFPLLDDRVTYPPLLRVMLFLWMSTFVVLVIRRYYQKAQAHNLTVAQDNELKYRLIFDSSLHVVLIHDGGKVLICNDAAAHLCGYKNADELIGKSFEDFIHPEDYGMVNDRAKRRLRGEHVPERYTHRILARDGIVRWVDSHSRVITFEGKQATLATAIDISHRQLIEEYLFRRVALDKTITAISTEFLNAKSHEIDKAVNRALQAIGEFAQVDHAYVMQFQRNDQDEWLTCTHEWVKEGIQPDMANYQHVTKENYPWAYSQLKQGLLVKVPDVADLPDFVVERQILVESGLKSFVEVPMIAQGQILGLVGFDSISELQIWEDDIIFLLRMMGEIFANAFERKRAEADLLQRNHELETLNALANIMTTTFDADELLSRIVHLFGEAFSVTSVYISDWDGHQNSIKVIAEYISPDACEAEKKSDLGMVYEGDPWARFVQEAYHEKPIPHWLIHRDDYSKNHEFIAHMQEYGGITVLTIPLKIEEKFIGFLDLWESRQRREYTWNELFLLQALTNQAAIMLDRARVNSELSISEQRNRVILNALPDLILRMGREGRFLEYTDNGMAIQSLDPELFLNKLPHDILSPSVADMLMERLQLVLANGKTQMFEYDFSRDNDTFYYEARLVKAFTDQALMFVRDITPLKESAQRQVELSFEKERVHILENFISDASHDLRTPIANLKSRLYLLKKSDTPEKQNRQIDVLEQEMIRLENLIEDLLTMTQLDGSILGKTLVEMELNYLIHEIVDATTPNAQNKGIVFKLDLSQAVPKVLGDPIEFSRMLTNFVSNAVNYTPEGGQVTIRTSAKDDKAIIEIEDTGMGIAEEDLPHIFDRFYRADKARNTDRGGTGLGLAIAKKIIEIHRGEISVKSHLNEGTTFRLSFPSRLPR